MSQLYRLFLLATVSLFSQNLVAQTIVKGKIIDASTKEPVAGASIHCADQGCICGCLTDASGAFEMKCTDCRTLSVSYIGYTTQRFAVSDNDYIVSLYPSSSQLQEIVLTANRGEGAKRWEAPVAI